MFISTAYAQGAGASPGGDLFSFFLPLVLIFVIFYFLLIRPQQKRQKEHQAKLAAARRGDKVLMGGGIHGEVTKVIDDNDVKVRIAEGVEVRVLKSTLIDVISKTEPVKDDGKAEKKGAAKKGAAKMSDAKQEDAADDAANDGGTKDGGEEKKGGLFGRKK
jgi:preprotein translocase subunit YajC